MIHTRWPRWVAVLVSLTAAGCAGDSPVAGAEQGREPTSASDASVQGLSPDRAAGPTATMTFNLPGVQAMGLGHGPAFACCEVDRGSLPTLRFGGVVAAGADRAVIAFRPNASAPIEDGARFSCVLVLDDGTIVGGGGACRIGGAGSISCEVQDWVRFETTVSGVLVPSLAWSPPDLWIAVTDGVGHEGHGSGGRITLLSADRSEAMLHPSSGPAVVDADAEGEVRHEVAADPRRLVGMRLLDDLGEHGWSTSARPDGSFSVQGFCTDADLWIRWGISSLGWKSDWTPVRRGSAAAQLALAPRK